MTAPAYDFTTDWSDSWINAWPDVFAEFVGKPGLVFVEIGSYEGRSAVWLVDNVLTGSNCKLFCIDPWATYVDRPGDVFHEIEKRFDRNAAMCSKPWVVQKWKSDSAGWLARNFLGRFLADVVFIDGSHRSDDVLTDAILAWRILKPGGVIVFDDYHWMPADGSQLGPGLAIDAFMAVHAGQFVQTFRGSQVVLRKNT